MSNIYRGDNGTSLVFTIKDEKGIVDIRGAGVDLVIKKGNIKMNKTATITDGENGKCELILNENDVDIEGVYYLQATVRFQNGSKFSTNVYKFAVSPLI